MNMIIVPGLNILEWRYPLVQSPSSHLPWVLKAIEWNQSNRHMKGDSTAWLSCSIIMMTQAPPLPVLYSSRLALSIWMINATALIIDFNHLFFVNTASSTKAWHLVMGRQSNLHFQPNPRLATYPFSMAKAQILRVLVSKGLSLLKI